jgi:hypothetical protein
MENDGDEPNAMPDTMPETTVEVQSNVPSTVNLDWMDSIDEESVAVSRWDGMRKAPQHTAFWNLPTPTRTFMPMPAVPNFVPCKIWMKANTIYAKIFEYDRQRVYEADRVDAGSLVKVVKDGWESLSFHEANNPVLQILKEVDQYLFCKSVQEPPSPQGMPALILTDRSCDFGIPHATPRGFGGLADAFSYSITLMPRLAIWSTCQIGNGQCEYYSLQRLTQHAIFLCPLSVSS